MDQCRTKTEIGHYFCQATAGNVCTKCLHDDEYNCLSCPNWAESMKAKGFNGTPITRTDEQWNEQPGIKCSAAIAAAASLPLTFLLAYIF